MHVVQLTHPAQGRRVAVVEEPRLLLLQPAMSTYELAATAIAQERSLAELVVASRSDDTLNYDEVYEGKSAWRLLPAFDHPQDPAHCLVTGTGLTHKASAENRDKMHEAQAAGTRTDSMRMYQWGVEGGRPAAGITGAQPEWFYKGTGSVLRAHGQTIEQPSFADDGGEEPEVVALYLVDALGVPWRLGFAAGNEFSDHVMEKKNYLYLAHSKLRQCAVGPELALDETFQSIVGRVTIVRDGQPVWSHEIASGEAHMAHGLENLEYHHFKYAEHRIAGQAHVHFLGAAAFSFGAQVRLEDGDTMEVAWQGFGRPLRNTLRIEKEPIFLPLVTTFPR
jgi:hypothetical protein